MNIEKLFKIQQDINNKLGNKIIFNLLNKDLKKIFQSNNYAVSDFILRYVNKSQKKIKFLNLGKENKWKKLLNKKIAKSVEETFNKEMSELGYLND